MARLGRTRMKIEARFYETYELCAIVNEILVDQFEHAVKLNAFHCDGQWVDLIRPFERLSAFHLFIEYVVREVHSEQAEAVDLDARRRSFANFQSIPPALEDVAPHRLPIEVAFRNHGIEHQSFLDFLRESGRTLEDADEDDVSSYMLETSLTEAYERLCEGTVSEVFHVLFQNRELLLRFNEFVAGVVERGDLAGASEVPTDLFEGGGTLKRVKAPRWAQRAVYFRDRGRCVLCDRDLSGLVNLENAENYDHMVPLARHGLNDVSNLQLLCSDCNRDKTDGCGRTSRQYQTWYGPD
jgi:hypothetical protein